MTDKGEVIQQDMFPGQSGGFLVEKADHAMGLELQLVELVEQQMRARVQHRDGDAEGLELEIGELRAELAATVDMGTALL